MHRLTRSRHRSRTGAPGRKRRRPRRLTIDTHSGRDRNVVELFGKLVTGRLTGPRGDALGDVRRAIGIGGRLLPDRLGLRRVVRWRGTGDLRRSNLSGVGAQSFEDRPSSLRRTIRGRWACHRTMVTTEATRVKRPTPRFHVKRCGRTMAAVPWREIPGGARWSRDFGPNSTARRTSEGWIRPLTSPTYEIDPAASPPPRSPAEHAGRASLAQPTAGCRI